MTIFRLFISVFILASFVSCSNADKTLNSTVFYSDFKEDFLKSDLMKYNYNPRVDFSSKENDTANFYRVIIRHDSSIVIIGTRSFSRDFNVRLDTFFKSDVILSKNTGSSYVLKSLNKEEVGSYLIPKQSQSINIIDYFSNLINLISKYRILEVSNHPLVNTKEIVFSEYDYLIYKPDSLVFENAGNKDFMKYLFENGKQLDKNWYQFNDKTKTNYH